MKKLLLLFGILSIVACKKEQDTNIIYGRHYFPADSGHYVIYDVIDIFHDELVAQHDTDIYQIKEFVGEEELDLEGEPFKKLYRYKRADSTESWALKDVWVLKKTDKSVELVEENQRKIKMAFSISYDQYWDCNAFNNDYPVQCYYDNIYQPITIGNIDYDSSVVVEHENFSSFIEEIRAYEVYAPNIGKIYSHQKHLQINNGDTLDIHKGTELYYSAIDWSE